MPRITALLIAATLAPLGACGGGFQDADAGTNGGNGGRSGPGDPGDRGNPDAKVSACDSLRYDGVPFEGVGCATGDGTIDRRLERGDVFAEVTVQCDAGCIVNIIVRDGTAEPGARNPDGGLAQPTGLLGDLCETDEHCAPGLLCDPETQLPTEIDGLPNGLPSVLSLLFPGGSCTPVPIGPYSMNSCDPLAPLPLQGCGGDGKCVLEPGFQDDIVACRRQCEPSADTSGCEQKFYTCDFSVKACVEGCQSDEECRASIVDVDGDGIGDALSYDNVSAAFCDENTRRCAHPGAGGETGDPCARLDDCESDGVCLADLQTFGGFSFPAGSCTKFGCYTPGRECEGDDAVCTTIRTFSGSETQLESCFTRCEVGADAADDVVGVDGHGAGCRPGYRCHYNGGAAGDGICVGGDYNDIADNNVGDVCEQVDDCYSGYGLGRCITLGVGQVVASTGVCTLMDCAAPGLPDDVCGEGNNCIWLSDDMTFCVRGCESADECSEGFACMDDDGSPATGKVCFPVCSEDADCREAQRCSIARGETVGECVEI